MMMRYVACLGTVKTYNDFRQDTGLVEGFDEEGHGSSGGQDYRDLDDEEG